jgi:hypothetical protein
MGSKRTQIYLKAAGFLLAVLASLAPHLAQSQVMSGWCTHGTGERLSGDINGDGQQDALCHDRRSGWKWLALRRGSQLHGEWVDRTTGWCRHDDAVLLLGDVNGDGKADLVCKDPGRIGIDYYRDGRFYEGADVHFDTDWCTQPGASFFIGDQNRDGRADMLCRGTDGTLWVLFADAEGRYGGIHAERRSPDFQITRIRRVSSGYAVHVRNNGADGIVTEVTCRVGSSTYAVLTSLSLAGGAEAEETVRLPLAGAVQCSVTGTGVDDQPELFISNNSFSAPGAETF